MYTSTLLEVCGWSACVTPLILYRHSFCGCFAVLLDLCRNMYAVTLQVLLEQPHIIRA